MSGAHTAEPREQHTPTRADHPKTSPYPSPACTGRRLWCRAAAAACAAAERRCMLDSTSPDPAPAPAPAPAPDPAPLREGDPRCMDAPRTAISCTTAEMGCTGMERGDVKSTRTHTHTLHATPQRTTSAFPVVGGCEAGRRLRTRAVLNAAGGTFDGVDPCSCTVESLGLGKSDVGIGVGVGGGTELQQHTDARCYSKAFQKLSRVPLRGDGA